MTHLRRPVAAAAIALIMGTVAHAQVDTPLPRPHVNLTAVAGMSQWDLSGTGSSLLLGVRADMQLGLPWLLGEASIATMRPNEQSGARTYVIPEAQLQIQKPGRFAPYLGGGVGSFRRVAGEPGPSGRITMSAAAGFRLWGVMPGAVLRGELRLRGIGSEFTASAAEWTGGIGWSF